VGPIRVWAPLAERVALLHRGSSVELDKDSDGWWTGPVLEHGEDYAFRVDGAGPLPDPRSASQPAGVHGPSRVVDHDRFAWTDAGWRPPAWETGLVYELHVGTFTPAGTFEAAVERLDHLVTLGVTHVELMPVAEFPGTRGWGYDGVDLYAPHHAYGGPDGLKRLVDACHRRGLAVLLDVVYNHLGPDGNHLGAFGPYFTDRYRTPWGAAVNLDGPHSDEVRRFFLDNARQWLVDYRLDGLRVDAVHAIVDTRALHFVEELTREVRAVEAATGRPKVLVAEDDRNDPRLVRPLEEGGYGLDAVWNEDFHHALHALLTGESDGYYRDFGRVADLAKVLTEGLVYDGVPSLHRRRSHGRPAVGVPGRRFVACLQNHDQVGNRAVGERTSRLLHPSALLTGAALVLTAPFVPMLFAGEEWGASTPFLYFTDHGDPDLAAAVRRGRRAEFAAFGWDPAQVPDPQDPATLAASRLDWEETEREPHRSVLEWHRALIALRRRLSPLTDDRAGAVRVSFSEEDRWLCLRRGPVLVVASFAAEPREIPVEGRLEPVLASHPGVGARDGMVHLPPWGVGIWRSGT
jgi:maltooligosyltrehalose trehalohydrolase